MESTDLDMADASERILEHRHRRKQLEAAAEEARAVLAQRREAPVSPGKATIIYTIPTPEDSPIEGADAAEIARNGGVRSIGHAGGPDRVRTCDLPIMSRMLFH